MPSVLSGTASPASAITTTTETLAANVPVTPLTEPSGSPQSVVIRGNVVILVGTAGTAVIVKLRLGQNNTTTAQVGSSEQTQAPAGATVNCPFEFIDPVLSDINSSGYSITVTQVAATGNGTLQNVNWEIDYSSH